MSHILIVGCGYTGRRVARLLRESGHAVTATVRNPASLADLSAAGTVVFPFDALEKASFTRLANRTTSGTRVLLSVPTLHTASGRFEATPRIVEALGNRPSHVVYLSTTGVYGSASFVDETTLPAPTTERQKLRVLAEQAVTAGPWPSLILRPAAIYGPGRGAHVALREGRFALPEGGKNYISRIHVDDLAVHCAQALLTGLTGAFPVADDEPARSCDIAAFCADLLGLPLPPAEPLEAVSETRRSNRRVDGSVIRRHLGVTLRYPSFRQGIPASLAAERNPPPSRDG